MRVRILVTIICFSIFAILFVGLAISYFKQSKHITDLIKKNDQIAHSKFCAAIATFFLVVVSILSVIFIIG